MIYLSKRSLRILGITITLLTLLIFFLSILFREEIQLFITHDAENYGLAAVFIIVFILELIPQYVSPHLIIINAGILRFSILSITALSILGTITSSLLGFYLGRTYGFEIIRNFYNKNKINYIDKKMDAYGKWFLVVAAMSPIPYLPIVFGSFNIKWHTFILYGVIPRIIGFIALGLLMYLL
ncbi:MAG: VTT domain-containing protein [Nanoarchaeota archaeon]|nr:VTT domain-containing protein [Nanoarchaeota archaeon]